MNKKEECGKTTLTKLIELHMLSLHIEVRGGNDEIKANG